MLVLVGVVLAGTLLGHVVVACPGDQGGGDELHAALRALAGVVIGDVRVHRADVGRGRGGLASSFIPHFGQRPGSSLDHLRMHRAGVADRSVPGGFAHVHLGDEGQDLVRLGLQVRE